MLRDRRMVQLINTMRLAHVRALDDTRMTGRLILANRTLSVVVRQLHETATLPAPEVRTVNGALHNLRREIKAALKHGCPSRPTLAMVACWLAQLELLNADG